MIETVETVPFQTPIMGILATFYSKEGVVLGPVAPRKLELKPDGPKLRWVLTFEVGWDGSRTIHVGEVAIHIGDIVRRLPVKVSPLKYDDDVLSLDYTMTAAFDDSETEQRRPWWRRKLPL